MAASAWDGLRQRPFGDWIDTTIVDTAEKSPKGRWYPTQVRNALLRTRLVQEGCFHHGAVRAPETPPAATNGHHGGVDPEALSWA